MQYKNLIKKLTQQNVNDRMSNQIVKTVLGDIDTLAAYQELVAAEQAVHGEIAVKLFEMCARIAGDLGVSTAISSDQIKPLNSKNAWFGFEDHAAKTLGVNIGCQFTGPNYRGLNFGFSLPKGRRKGSDLGAWGCVIGKWLQRP